MNGKTSGTRKVCGDSHSGDNERVEMAAMVVMVSALAVVSVVKVVVLKMVLVGEWQ